MGKRRIMISCIVFVLLIIFLISSNLNARNVKGIVFDDQNKNLKFDNGEPGIPGVLVSNQIDVVQTDADGQFKIAVEDENIIFITKPTGYQTPVNENNLPQF